jgi:hypothetical protein
MPYGVQPASVVSAHCVCLAGSIPCLCVKNELMCCSGHTSCSVTAQWSCAQAYAPGGYVTTAAHPGSHHHQTHPVHQRQFITFTETPCNCNVACHTRFASTKLQGLLSTHSVPVCLCSWARTTLMLTCMSAQYCSHATERMAAAVLQLILLQSPLQPLLPASCAGGPCSCPGWCCWCVVKLQDERVGRGRVLSQALLLLDDLANTQHAAAV